MPSKKPQSRRSRAARVAETPKPVERVDPSLLQQLIKVRASVDTLKQQLAASQGAADFVWNEIAERHGLAEGDQFDMGTGVIKRKGA